MFRGQNRVSLKFTLRPELETSVYKSLKPRDRVEWWLPGTWRRGKGSCVMGTESQLCKIKIVLENGCFGGDCTTM